MDVAHHTSADKDVFHGAQVRVLEFLMDGYVVELDVEVLVDRLEGALDFDVIFEFDCHRLVDEGFEEAVFGLVWEKWLVNGL